MGKPAFSFHCVYMHTHAHTHTGYILHCTTGGIPTAALSGRELPPPAVTSPPSPAHEPGPTSTQQSKQTGPFPALTLN